MKNTALIAFVVIILLIIFIFSSLPRGDKCEDNTGLPLQIKKGEKRKANRNLPVLSTILESSQESETSSNSNKISDSTNIAGEMLSNNNEIDMNCTDFPITRTRICNGIIDNNILLNYNLKFDSNSDQSLYNYADHQSTFIDENGDRHLLESKIDDGKLMLSDSNIYQGKRGRFMISYSLNTASTELKNVEPEQFFSEF